jgi:hypothetical protein
MPTSAAAWGINVQCYGQFDASRVRVTGSVGIGTGVFGGCPPLDGAPAPTPGTSTLMLHDCIVENTRAQDGPAISGWGAAAAAGGTMYAERTLVTGATSFGAATEDDGSAMTWNDSAILGTRAWTDGSRGNGLIADHGTTVSATRLYVQGAREFGVFAVSGGSVDLHDVIVAEVQTSSRGVGLGVASAGGSMLTGERVAVTHAAGAAFGSISRVAEAMGAPSQMSITDAFVLGVAPSVLSAGEPNAAYGFHAGEQSTLMCVRGVVDGAGYGFYDASGTMGLDTAIIAHQSNALGASAGAGLFLVNVQGTQNANDGVVNNVSLPAAGGLAPPPLPSGCTPQGCM